MYCQLISRDQYSRVVRPYLSALYTNSEHITCDLTPLFFLSFFLGRHPDAPTALPALVPDASVRAVSVARDAPGRLGGDIRAGRGRLRQVGQRPLRRARSQSEVRVSHFPLLPNDLNNFYSETGLRVAGNGPRVRRASRRRSINDDTPPVPRRRKRRSLLRTRKLREGRRRSAGGSSGLGGDNQQMYVSRVLYKISNLATLWGKDFSLKLDLHVGCTSQLSRHLYGLYTAILGVGNFDYHVHWCVALQQMDPRVRNLPKDQLMTNLTMGAWWGCRGRNHKKSFA